MSEERIAAIEARLAVMEGRLARGTPIYLGGGEALARLHSLQPIYVDTRDISVCSHIMLDGHWEPWVEAPLMQLLRPGMSFCDVGAHVGYYTLLGGARVGPAGRVCAFEPNARFADMLRRSVAINGLAGHVAVHAVAAGAEPAELTLAVDPVFAGGASLMRAPGQGEVGMTVPVVTLDSVLAAWPALDVMKIDVEGFEPAVLAGAAAIMARSPNLAMVIEFDLNAAFPEGPRAYLEGLAAQGFALEVIVPSGVVPLPNAEAVLALMGGFAGFTGYLRLRRGPLPG